MLQAKIKILSLYTAIGLGCLCIVLAVSKIMSFPSQASTTELGQAFAPTEPQVLGISTSTPIRGESVAETTTSSLSFFIQRAPFDLKGVTAKSFLAYDIETGQVFVEKNVQDKLSIASLTKLLTALVCYSSADLSEEITIRPADVMNTRPILRLQAGDKVKVRDLLNAMLVGSNNDAALALSRYVSDVKGVTFTELMNQKAEELGMELSHFSNPLGFDSLYNYSTADDLKKLVNATQRIPFFQELGRKIDYSFLNSEGKLFTTKTTNSLIAKYPEIQAVKTGFTEGAQGSMINRISFQGRKIIIIVLGSEDREQDTLKIKNEIEKTFQLEQ